VLSEKPIGLELLDLRPNADSLLPLYIGAVAAYYEVVTSFLT
jgi:hypothetical protein